MSLKILDWNDLPHELLRTRQKTKLKNAFNNNMSTGIKLSKAQVFKTIQSGGFLGSLLNNVTGPLVKVLAPLGITAAASGMNAGIPKKYTFQEQQR